MNAMRRGLLVSSAVAGATVAERSIVRRAFLSKLLLAGVVCLLGPSVADGQTWPDHPIHIIVPLPAGSAADTVARLIGAGLSSRLGQSVVVDNREGGSGVIGTSLIAHSDADGYTIGIATTTTLVTAPILNRASPYNAKKDFQPIAMVGVSPYVLVTNPSLPARSVSEFIALAKSKPGKLTYSSDGEASLARLSAELFSSMTGIALNQVPYKTSTQAVVDLLAGRIDAQFGILTTTQQYIREGRLNAIGVTTVDRLPQLPDVQTIAESGLKGFESVLWLAIVAPARMPQPVATRLNSEVTAVLNESAIKSILAAQAITVRPMSVESVVKRIDDDYDKWGALVDKLGL